MRAAQNQRKSHANARGRWGRGRSGEAAVSCRGTREPLFPRDGLAQDAPVRSMAFVRSH